MHSPRLADPVATRPLSAWIFNHYAADPGHPAGTRHFDLARRMRRLGIETTIFASSFSHFSGRDEKVHGPALWRGQSLDGVRFVWVRTPPYAGNGFFRATNMLAYSFIAAAAQVTRPSPDIIVGSSVHPFAALAGYVVARARRRPFVYEIRDLWPETLIAMGTIAREGFSARLLYALERRLVLNADAVVSLLPDVARYFSSRSLLPRRLLYVPNGTLPSDVDPGEPPVGAARLIESWRRQGAVVFGYVGAHGRANGLDVLLDAMRLVPRAEGPPICLVLVGDGPFKPSLQRRKAVEGLHRVEFLDPIPKHAIRPLLSSLDAGVFHLAANPVFEYGISSNKLFDYMESGIPVIFACSSGYDPVARADAGLSIPPEDPHALAAAMRDLASRSGTERSRIGERGRSYVRREHDIDVLSMRLARLFRELIDNAAT